ncbi:MAG: hypothetical protein OQJ89_00910 [Kangiellaceae bacterium]|nr:hypothetical protein [Kangiellaceae bacterium]MCW8998742.1 hypothetical protein [Kangiellaceae bacterium]MCW9015501.1 hypothetical protein [Kangiellaceae bacterium]
MYPIKTVVSWSSGKDSTLSLLRLLDDPRYSVVGLFTTHVEKNVPFQHAPLHFVKKQASLMKLPLVTIELPEVFPANDIYQSCVINGLKSSQLEFDAVAFGDMFCNGIAEYRQSYIRPAGWQCVFPLLGEGSACLAREIIDRKIRTFISTVDTSQLSTNFVGHEYNLSLLKGLPANVDPCGEDGEFHTLVYDAPCFSRPIGINKSTVIRDDRFHIQSFSYS